MAAVLVIGAAVWFYFLTLSTKSFTYAPTIMVGTGMSAMFVMALNYITELIGDNKVRTGLKLSHTRSAN